MERYHVSEGDCGCRLRSYLMDSKEVKRYLTEREMAGFQTASVSCMLEDRSE